jgi:hypothetical protein
LDQIAATMTLDTTVAFDIIVAFVIPLVSLLTSSHVMWHEDTFGISVYSKEYTFLIIIIITIIIIIIVVVVDDGDSTSSKNKIKDLTNVYLRMSFLKNGKLVISDDLTSEHEVKLQRVRKIPVR